MVQQQKQGLLIIVCYNVLNDFALKTMTDVQNDVDEVHSYTVLQQISSTFS